MGKEGEITKTYRLQRENQAAQNEWQHAENDIDRQWQASEWQRQFEEQMRGQMEMFREQLGLQNEADFAKWKKQFDLENQYNDPSSQVARMMAAGINPAAAASQLLNGGNSTANIGGSSSPAASSAPSGGAIGSHQVTPLGVSGLNYSTNAAMFSSLAQLGDSLGKMAQSGVGSVATARKVKPEIEKMMAETDKAREETALTRINKDIQDMFGKQKVGSEIMQNVTRSYTAYTEGSYNEARAALAKATELLTDEQRQVLSEQRPELLANLKLLGQVYDSERKVNLEEVLYKKSGEVANYARAELDMAIKQTEDDLRRGKVTEQTLRNGISAIDFGLKTNAFERDNETQKYQIQRIFNECRTAGFISEKTYQEWRSLVKDNNWKDLEKSIGAARGFLGIPTSAVGVSVPFAP